MTTDDHFRQKTIIFWSKIKVSYPMMITLITLDINQFVRRKFVIVIINLQHIGQTSRLCIQNTRLGLPLFPYPTSNRTCGLAVIYILSMRVPYVLPITSSSYQCFSTFWVVVLRCCIVSSDVRHSKFAAHSRETHTMQHYGIAKRKRGRVGIMQRFPIQYLNLWSKTMDATILIEYTHMHATITDVYIYIY